MAEFPTHARIVVIGGGAVGCSCLYHLARAGWTDAVLLEKTELTAGSTWHAAGNCPNYVASWSMMRLQHYSTELYRRLGDEVDYPMNYHVTGAVRLAHSRARMQEFRHVVSMGRWLDVPISMLTLEELREKHPFVETHDLEGALWDETDGDIDPAQLAQAFARGARAAGARTVTHCAVTGARRTSAGEWEIETDQGAITAEYVVNAAGYRAPGVGALFGREVPSVPMSHQYLVTEAIPDLAGRNARIPLLRDPDVSYYLRQERDGLVLGPYEWRATPHWVRRDDPMPDDFSFELWPDDLDRLEHYIDDACRRVPILGSAGIRRVVNGPIPYTPDGNPLIGPMPGVPNAFEACVFTFGIVQAGGAGKVLAEWVTEGETEWDMWAVDPRRFTEFATPHYCEARAIEVYRNEYAIGYPHEERAAGRPVRTSPLYARLAAQGALFGARAGWERPAWYPRTGRDEARDARTFDRPHWHEAVGREVTAVATGVGLLDLPGFARFAIRGTGAADWLAAIVAGRLPRIGRTALAYALTAAGRVRSEFTVTRFGEDHFWLIGAGSAAWHDRDWLEQHRPAGAAFTIEEIGARWGTLVLAGPRSREVLATVTDADVSDAALPWLAHTPLALGPAHGHVLRVSYSGEAGYELHVPMETLVGVYERLRTAGEPHGIVDFGIYALDSMRLEKGYRAWKADLSTDWGPFAAGLARFVDLDKPAFIGRDGARAEAAAGPADVFVTLVVSTDGAEAPYLATVWYGGARVGLVTSGGYGHRVRASIALAYVRRELARPGTRLEVEIHGDRRPAEVRPTPLYDPYNARLQG